MSYDEKYRASNFFGYRRWLYRSYIKALISKAQLKSGDRILDGGCGQGFFTALFAENGLNAVGIDISSAGIEIAQRTYTSPKLRFQVGDVLTLDATNGFDCVFCRSCSLYNSEAFQTQHKITNRLLDYVKPGGLLIFDYYSKLDRRKEKKGWIYHSVENVRSHFRRYPGAKTYFSLRFDALFVGRYAFTSSMTAVSTLLCRGVGIGGELLALVRKPVA